MPAITPKQKINQVKMFGNGLLKLCWLAIRSMIVRNMRWSFVRQQHDIHSAFRSPQDHWRTGNCWSWNIGWTFGVDYFCSDWWWWIMCGPEPIFSKPIRPKPKLLALSHRRTFHEGSTGCRQTHSCSTKIQRFVDGASVKKVGDLTFELCKDNITDMVLVPEGKSVQPYFNSIMKMPSWPNQPVPCHCRSRFLCW